MPETLPITDQHLISRIEREQERRGDKRPTQTAVTLLTEYLTLIEHRLAQHESDGSLKGRQPAAASTA